MQKTLYDIQISVCLNKFNIGAQPHPSSPTVLGTELSCCDRDGMIHKTLKNSSFAGKDCWLLI